MHISNKEARLNRFYGDIARSQNRDIINLISGKRVLDIGCGYGTLINQIKKEKGHIEVAGIDVDEEAIKIAKHLYGIDVNPLSVYAMNFEDNSFDTVILRDAIHHFNADGNLKLVLNEIKRVCRKELIIFDPNPNWILRFSRKIINHEDPEAPLRDVVKALNDSGFKVEKCRWRDVIAFPLSGGFVGKELVPNINFFKKIIIVLDNCINFVLRTLKIQRYVCWRYLIYAVKANQD